MAKKAYVYNGSAWEDLASSISDLSSYATTVDLDDYQLKSVAGLTLVKTQVIGSAVTSVNVTGAFSATYDNYRVIVSGNDAQYFGSSMGISFNASTSTTYKFAGNDLANYSATNTISGASTQSSVRVARSNHQSTNNFLIEIANPFLALQTTLSSRYTGGYYAGSYYGIDTNAVSHTDFTITITGGGATMTGGTIAVYGYAK